VKPAIGQYWKNVSNGDLLKILGTSIDDENGLTYVKAAYFVLGKQFLGVQERQEKWFDGERFQLVKPWFGKRWWLTAQLYRPTRTEIPGKRS
jgi:hypothetical protein